MVVPDMDMPTGVIDLFLSQGVLGAVAALLLYFIYQQRIELRETRAAHKIEIAAKDAQIADIQEARVTESKAYGDLAKTAVSALEMLTVTARRGKA